MAAMKRINAFLVIILYIISLTTCRQIASGMEKAFGCEVGKTTYEEFCNLFPKNCREDSLGFSWNTDFPFLGGGRGSSGVLLSETLKEGSFYGTVYQNIHMGFDNGVLSSISFEVNDNANEIDNIIELFRARFSRYYDSEEANPSFDGGIAHHQIFFNDGLTTLLLWKRDYSQCDPSVWRTNGTSLEISILNNRLMKYYLDIIRTK